MGFLRNYVELDEILERKEALKKSKNAVDIMCILGV
jgi:SUMO ligase MMS21 Smc5/6 complex component